MAQPRLRSGPQSTWSNAAPPPSASAVQSPIRRFISWTDLANSMPIGIAGEMCIGGVGVATGYLGRPGLTAARFLPDLLSERAGARLYRTGDLGCWGADGKLQHLGRLDHQVKIRGFRIELGEIETLLRGRMRLCVRLWWWRGRPSTGDPKAGRLPCLPRREGSHAERRAAISARTTAGLHDSVDRDGNGKPADDSQRQGGS